MTGTQSSVREDLRAAVSLVALRGRHVWVGGRALVRIAPEARRQAATALEAALYSQWFTRAQSTPSAGGTMPGSVVARVRAAHAASGQFERGWVAHTVGPGGVVAAVKHDARLYFHPPDYVNRTRGRMTVHVGDSVAVTCRRDAIDADGAWWSTWSRAQPSADQPLVRVYWNCGADAVADLVREITSVLEPARRPYSLKCPTHAGQFARLDPVVLYLSPQAWVGARADLRDAHDRLRPRLRVGIPPLTCRLAPGVAIADDPGDGSSFGQSRTRAVAGGLLRAAALNITDREVVTEFVLRSLSSFGVNPDRPYERVGGVPDDDRWSW